MAIKTLKAVNVLGFKSQGQGNKGHVDNTKGEILLQVPLDFSLVMA